MRRRAIVAFTIVTSLLLVATAKPRSTETGEGVQRIQLQELPNCRLRLADIEGVRE